MEYRKELDGLRALAVFGVIVYHAKMHLLGGYLFSGGFFGVDVFLVLSGYFITSIIKASINNNNFSLINFYWRRAKRIVPALLFVLAVTTVVAYYILLPNDLVTYAKSLQSALYFGSNFYYYFEDSYTAPASIYKALLHTWSLGVEWQFYMLYPLIIWVIYKYFKNYAFAILLAIGFVSLQSADILVKNHPDFAFYLLPTRGWELIAGGLCTFINRNFIAKAQGNLKLWFGVMPLLGLYLILHSFLFINDKTALPSFLTLLPVLGTCLIIIFAQPKEIVSNFLSLKPVVFVGIISYSLYLWHQPVLVFFRFLKYDNIKYLQLLLLFLLSISLATLSYYLIENPFRRFKKNISLAIGLLLVIVGLSVVAQVIILNKGFANRFKDIQEFIDRGEIFWSSALEKNDKFENCEGKIAGAEGVGRRCSFVANKNARNIILVGDSYAEALAANLYYLAKQRGYNFINLSLPSCPTVINVGVGETGIKDNRSVSCNAITKQANRIISANPNAIVVYSINIMWYLFAGEESSISQNGKSFYDNAYKQLSSWRDNGNSIVFIHTVPVPNFNVANEAKKHLIIRKNENAKLKLMQDKAFLSFNRLNYPKRWVNANTEYTKADDLFNSITGKNILHVYPNTKLCNNNICYTHNSKHLYYHGSSTHLNYYGAKLVVEDIAKELTKLD